MHLDDGTAIFQVVLHGDGLAGQLALLAHGHEGLVQIVCHRHAEDKSAGLRAYYHIKIHTFQHLLDALDGQMQAVCILQHAGHVAENDTLLRKIRNASYVFFYFLHEMFLHLIAGLLASHIV